MDTVRMIREAPHRQSADRLQASADRLDRWYGIEKDMITN